MVYVKNEIWMKSSLRAYCMGGREEILEPEDQDLNQMCRFGLIS